MTELNNPQLDLLSHMVIGERLNSDGFLSRDSEGINLFFSLLGIEYIEHHNSGYYDTIDIFSSTKIALHTANKDGKIWKVIEALKNPDTEEFIERHFGEWSKTQVSPNLLTQAFQKLDEQIQATETHLREGRNSEAVTCSYRFVETSFYIICDHFSGKGLKFKTGGKFKDNFVNIKKHFEMRKQEGFPDYINKMLETLDEMTQEIIKVRNSKGVSHGTQSNSKEVKPHHARLIFDMALSVNNFLLSVCKNRDDKFGKQKDNTDNDFDDLPF